MIFKNEISSFLNDVQDYLFPNLFSNRTIKKDDIIFDLCKMFKTLKVKDYKASQYIEKLSDILLTNAGSVCLSANPIKS